MKSFKKTVVNFLFVALIVAGVPFHTHAAVLDRPAVSEVAASGNVITVVTAAPVPNIVINLTEAACSLPLSNSGGNLVQNPAPINLNQPASCLPLKLGNVHVQNSLAVAPIVPPPSIYVHPRHKQEIAYGLDSRGELPLGLPVGVLSAAIVFTVASFAKRRRVYTDPEGIESRFPIAASFTLSQLQVFRC